MGELKEQFSKIKGVKDADDFHHYFIQATPQAAGHRSVRNLSEFENFSCMRTVCEDFGSDSKKKGRHSEEQAGHFCTFFVQRPSRILTQEDRDYTYSQ